MVIIKGSGVNLDEFKYSTLRKGRKIITMISRIIKDKGVLEFAEVATILKKFDGDFILVGNIDKNNPSAISNSLVQKWKKEKILNVINFKSKIYKYIKTRLSLFYHLTEKVSLKLSWKPQRVEDQS